MNTERLYITFDSKEDIIEFVTICEKYDDAIDISVHNMRMDAKSIVGMLLMELHKQLLIVYQCYDEEDNYMEFREEILQKCKITVIPS